MSATEVIETYIDDTVRLLPMRQRDDVARELRSLLIDELHARAEESGGVPDRSLALSLVRGYGQPNEVAARYRPPWAIIDPADSTSFMRAALIGAGTLVLFAGISKWRPSQTGTGENLVQVGVLVWLGLLVVAFGAKSWVRRRWPATGLWEPRDRDRVNRIGTAVIVPIATFFVVLYCAPTWVLDQVSGGRLDTSWAAYTANFQRLRLPFFIALMVGLLALLSFAAIEGRRSRLTRRIDIALNLALACLLFYLAVDGNIFQSTVVDKIAREVLALVATIYIPCVGIMLYDEIGRIHGAGAGKEA